VVERAARALSNLSLACPAAQRAVAAAGGVKALARLLAARVAAVLKQVLAALANLVLRCALGAGGCWGAGGWGMGAGAAPQLPCAAPCGRLRCSREPRARSPSAPPLRPGAAALVAAGRRRRLAGLPALVLRPGPSPSTRRHPANQALLLQQPGALPELARVLRLAHPGVQERAALLATNLSWSCPQGQAALLQAGALPPLLRLLGSSHSGVVQVGRGRLACALPP
jgi:hypothetical protein